MEHPDSPPPQGQMTRQIAELQQEQDGEEAVVLVSGGTHTGTTIYDLHDDVLRISHALLGVGHFR